MNDVPPEQGSRNVKTILSYTAGGTVVPYSMMDIQHSLDRLGYRVYVQNLHSIESRRERLVAFVDGLAALEPDLIVTIDRVGLIPLYMAVVDRPHTVISWCYDDPLTFLTDDFLAINSKFHLFCWDRVYLPKLAPKGYQHLHYQPFATNAGINKPVPGNGYEYDVSFVGTCSERRMALIRLLAESGIRIDVFGNERWRELPHPNVIYHGAADNRVECPKIYSRSKINLNITNEQLLTALPVRVFDVLACGGFLLTDAKADAFELFNADKELVVYADEDDLCRKIRYFLGHPDERDRIRRAGRDKTVTNYTFDKIFPSMISTALAEKGDETGNLPVPGEKLVRVLLLVALSYMKFGKYHQAYIRLKEALKIDSGNEFILFALTVLASRIGDHETVAFCMEQLQALRSSLTQWKAELMSEIGQGGQVKWWDKLYPPGFHEECRFNADGTTAHWRPPELVSCPAGE